MAMVGYLRAVPTDIADGSGKMQYRLSIPNRDVARAVYWEMRGAHPLGFTSVERFKRTISEGNEEGAEAIMARMMDDRAIASFGDRAWRIMMLELVYEMSEGCETRIEAPSEGGWIGISFGPKAQDIPGIVLALDTADGEKDPDAGAAEALERARDSKLLGDMMGRTILVGTACKDGILKVKIGASMNGDGSPPSDDPRARQAVPGLRREERISDRLRHQRDAPVGSRSDRSRRGMVR